MPKLKEIYEKTYTYDPNIYAEPNEPLDISSEDYSKQIVSTAIQTGTDLRQAETIVKKRNQIKQGLWKKTKRAWKRGDEAANIDFVWAQAYAGSITNEQALAKTKDFEQKVKENPIDASNWAEDLWLKTVAIVPPMASGAYKGASYGFMTGGVAAIAGQAGPQVMLPEEIISVPAAFKIGQTWGSLTYWTEQGIGSIYRDAKNAKISDKNARLVASIGGPIYAAIEFSQVDRLVPGLRHSKRTILRIALNYLKKVGLETLEESEQKVVTDGSVLVGKMIEGIIKAEDLPSEIKKIALNALKEGKEAIGPMLLLAFPDSAIDFSELGIQRAEDIKSERAKGNLSGEEIKEMESLREDYEKIVEEGGPLAYAKLKVRIKKQKLLDLQKPIPAIREGATQSEIQSIEAEVAERPVKIQQAVIELIEAQEFEYKQAQEHAQAARQALIEMQSESELVENIQEEIRSISGEIDDLSKPISAFRKGEKLMDVDSVDLAIGERDARFAQLQERIQSASDSLEDIKYDLSVREEAAAGRAITSLKQLQDSVEGVRIAPQKPYEPVSSPAPPTVEKGAIKQEGPPKKPPEQKTQWAETTPPEDSKSGAAKVEEVYNRADIELKRIKDAQKGLGKFWRKVKRATWDTSASIKKSLLKEGGKYGKEAVIRHDLIKGANSKSTRIINDATKDIYKGLGKNDVKTLDRIIQSRRIMAIDKYKPARPGEKPLFATMKHPGGLSAEEHRAYIDNLPEKTRAKLNAKADAYFKTMRSQLDALRENGLINEESYEALKKAGDYEPRRFIQHIDPERTGYDSMGRVISVPDSGLKALEQGSFEALENDSQLLLGEVVRRTQARIARNNANQALWQMIKDVPDNGIVFEADIENIKKGEYTYKKAPTGYEKISVVVDGVTRQMVMPKEIAVEWVGSDPLLPNQAAQWFGWLSGAKILKPMATGINPEFALTNFPRDIAHVLLTTEEYSPHLPIAIGQMIKDFNAVKNDVITRKGRWLDYIDEGGGMEFLTHQGAVTSKTRGVLGDLQTALGYMGETSEIWTRLALRERAIRNGKSSIEATWIARNYLDFSQGGNAAKAIDTVIPYFNASIQGTRGIFRAAGQNPKVFTYKVAQLGMLATGLMLANRYRNREAWDNISSHDKANYFIFTTPFSYKDKNGDKRYLYFRVAKDQGQKVITSLFENLMAKYLGDDIDVDQVTDAARGMIVMTPSEMMPPVMDAILGYANNKDFWRNKDIWQGGQVVKKEEYTAYTHPAYVKWGEVSGMSPEKTKYALQQFFTYGNIYTSMVDWGLGNIMKEMPEKEREKITEDILRQQPFIRRILKATDPYTEFEKTHEKMVKEENTRRLKQNRELDKLVDKLFAKEIDESDIDDYIDKEEHSISDASRLRIRFNRIKAYKNIPDRRWWLSVSEMPPEIAANAYWARYITSDRKKKEELEHYKDTLPGINTKEFIIKLDELKRKAK